jgi:hypothetical protein
VPFSTDYEASDGLRQRHEARLLDLLAAYARDKVAELLAAEPALTGAELLARLTTEAEQARATRGALDGE